MHHLFPSSSNELMCWYSPAWSLWRVRSTVLAVCSRRKLCSSACLARLNALPVTFNVFLRLGSWGRARSLSRTCSLTFHACRRCAWARGDSLKPLEEGRFGRRGSVSADVWRKMSANVETMELTSGMPAAKVESGSLVTISCATVALQH